MLDWSVLAWALPRLSLDGLEGAVYALRVPTFALCGVLASIAFVCTSEFNSCSCKKGHRKCGPGSINTCFADGL